MTKTHSGFTLTEVMITVGILAILAAMAVPMYQKTMERSYWRGSQDMLQTVYAGEQVFWTANDTYTNPAACAPVWRCIYMDNPNTGSNMPVAFSVTSPGGAWKTKFTSTASRGDGRCMKVTEATRVVDTSGGSAAGCTKGWPQP